MPVAEHLRALAAFATTWTSAPLPTEVDRFGRVLLLDTIGALVGATRYREVGRLRTALGDGHVEDPLPFAQLFRLGAAATWLDADSGGSFHPQGHRMPPVPTAHPAPHVLPVLLHHAKRGTPDSDLFQSFVISVEIGMRFGTATSLRPGLHPHGIHGPVAAAAAESLLRGHDERLLAASLARALTNPLAARLWQPMEGGTVRNAWTGLGTYYGARAAAEAEWRPATSGESIKAALSSVFTTATDLDVLSDRLGSQWVFLQSYLKPYACARWIHPALDATGLALAEGPGKGAVEAIRSVEVETFAFAASLQARTVPRTDLHARFDLPTCVATFAVDGQLHAPGFLPERLQRPEVSALRNRVAVRENREFTAALPSERPTSVTITWSDGSRTSGSVRNAKGNPDHPMGFDEVIAKFTANVDTVLTEPVVQRCISWATGTTDERAVLEQVATAVA
jgi:2-methylcitrate dehydratase PrpD